MSSKHGKADTNMSEPLQVSRRPIADNRIRFGKRVIDCLKPNPERRLHYYDTQTPKLELLAYPSGAKVFYFYGRIGNDPARVKLGRYPEMSPDEARKAAARYSSEVINGRDPRQPIRAARSELTFAAFFAIYLERHARPRKKSWKEDENVNRRYLKPLANRQLSAITRRDVERLHSDLGMNAPYQANRLLALLRVVFNKASDWGYFDGKNPAVGVVKFKEVSRARRLFGHDMSSIFKAVESEPNQSVRDCGFFTSADRGSHC